VQSHHQTNPAIIDTVLAEPLRELGQDALRLVRFHRVLGPHCEKANRQCWKVRGERELYQWQHRGYVGYTPDLVHTRSLPRARPLAHASTDHDSFFASAKRSTNFMMQLMDSTTDKSTTIDLLVYKIKISKMKNYFTHIL